MNLALENERLRADNAEQRMQILELSQDLDYLQRSIEDNIPLVAELEKRNKQLEERLNNGGKSSTALRNTTKQLHELEEQYAKMLEKHKSEKDKYLMENKSYRERLEATKQLNISVNKNYKSCQKRLEQLDFITMKCNELQMANAKLVNILWQKEDGLYSRDG